MQKMLFSEFDFIVEKTIFCHFFHILRIFSNFGLSPIKFTIFDFL